MCCSARCAGCRPGGVGHSPSSDHRPRCEWGYLDLRETIERLLNGRTIHVNARQVLLTQGASHALDLIIRHFLDAGDKALVDSPGYCPLFGKLKLGKVEMIGIARLPDGPDLDALQAVVHEHKPKVFFTQTLAHNPTGGSISLPKAHRLLQLAAQHDFLRVASSWLRVRSSTRIDKAAPQSCV